MIKRSKIRKQSVYLHTPARPSRIRRDPARATTQEMLARDAWWQSREWEIRLGMAGVIFFALAISAAVIDIGQLLGR